MTIEQFIPSGTGGPDKEEMREAVASLRPDMTEDVFDSSWAGFFAMRERVNNPRRRVGGDMRRAGPVLFDPVHYIRSEADR